MHKKTHLWIVNHYAGDGSSAGSSRHYLLARELSKLGWEVTIFASATLFKSKVSRIDDGQRFRLEKKNGVRFVWVRTTPYVGNGSGRIRSMLEFYFRVKKNSLHSELSPPDIIIGSTVHPFAALAAYRISKKFCIPFLFEIRDLWPQTLIDMGKVRPYHPAAILFRKIERLLFQKARAVITLLPGVYKYAQRYGLPSEKIIWVSNGVDISGFSTPKYPVSDRNKTLTLMYLGSHGEANGLHTLIEAMGLLNSELRDGLGQEVVLRLVGDGPLKSSLVTMAQTFGVLNKTVYFEDPVPKTQVPEIASMADGFVIPVLNLPHLYQYGISMNKIFDYMAAGRPTIISVSSFNNPIDEANGGITIHPEDPEQMAKAIVDFSNLDPEVRSRLGRNARKHVENFYSYEALAKKMNDALRESLTSS